MRILIYTLGILALTCTDFRSESQFFSRFLPLVDFAFVVFLLYDFLLFQFRLQDDGLLIGLDSGAPRPGWWERIYSHWLEHYDHDGAIGIVWDSLRTLLEWLLMMAGLVQAALLIVRAIVETGF